MCDGLSLLLLGIFFAFPRLLFDEVVDEHAEDILDILLTLTGILFIFLTKILGGFFRNLRLLLVFADQ